MLLFPLSPYDSFSRYNFIITSTHSSHVRKVMKTVLFKNLSKAALIASGVKLSSILVDRPANLLMPSSVMNSVMIDTCQYYIKKVKRLMLKVKRMKP
jgi:hypothetical protein